MKTQNLSKKDLKKASGDFKTHRFYKDAGGWFIDLPGFPGPKSALAMVAGADSLLDKLSGFTDGVTLSFSALPCIDFELELKRTRIKGAGISGADYIVNSSSPKTNGHMLWLCPVTLYVFGKYPKSIWVKTL